MTGAQLDSMGTDARGSEHTAGGESGGPGTQIPLGEESVFGSNAEEYVASRAGRAFQGRVDGPFHGGRTLSSDGAEY